MAELLTIDPPVVVAGQTTEITVRGTNLEELTSLQLSDERIEFEHVGGETFRVTAPGDLASEIVELRAVGYFGLSTSRPLVIARTDRQIVGDSASSHVRDTAPVLPVEALGHGNVDEKQIDWWKFTARKGDRLLVHCHAERIDSSADATLALVDRNGRELERNRDTVGRDPMLDFSAPADGDYFVGVHDFLYRGGSAYPYLIEITRRPWIDAVFPPAVPQGQATDLTLLGRNLPGGSRGEGWEIDGKSIETVNVRVTPPAGPGEPRFDPNRPSRALLPTFSHRLEDSPSVDIGLADLPVTVVENDAEIPPLVPPGEIAARFETDGDSDEFAFMAEAGKTYWIEVVGDRIAARIDPFLEIADGKAKADDAASGGGPTFDDASRDPSVRFTAEKAGECRVIVGNHFATGGPDHGYRLAIREASPDFALLGILERPYLDQRQAVPATPHLRKGGTFPVRILVQRRDGFDGPVTLAAEGLPEGVSCPPVTVSGKESVAHLVFAASPDAPDWAGNITVVGTATIGDQEIRRELRAGTLVAGTGDYNVSRPRSRLALGLPLSVSEHEKAPVSLEVGGGRKFTATIGQTLEIPVKITARHGLKGDLAITPVGLRGLAKPPSLSIAENKDEGILKIDFTVKKDTFTPEPGRWNFLLKAVGTTKYRHNPEAADRAAAEVKQLEAAADTDPKALEEARQRAKAAADRAKEKDLKFAAWSLPIEVEVKAAPEEKAP